MRIAPHPFNRSVLALLDLLRPDGTQVLQFLAIFAVLVIVLMSAYLLLRRSARRKAMAEMSRPAAGARQPRLGIVDVYELDKQRQLILLRRDNVEHLLLVGGPNDVVVEHNIQRSAVQRQPVEPTVRTEPRVETPPSPAKPAASGTATPSPVPVTAHPVVPVTARAEPKESTRPVLPALVASRDIPPDDLSPPVTPAVRDVTSNPAPHASAEPQAVDPELLSEMARQLEISLNGPEAGEAVPAVPVEAEQTSAPPRPDVDPVASGMGEASDATARVGHPVAAPPSEQPPPPPVQQVPATPPVQRPITVGNTAPFSVEEIEAEFARLLGRPLGAKRN